MVNNREDTQNRGNSVDDLDTQKSSPTQNSNRDLAPKEQRNQQNELRNKGGNSCNEGSDCDVDSNNLDKNKLASDQCSTEHRNKQSQNNNADKAYRTP